jgi:putative glutamine amidotransferase
MRSEEVDLIILSADTQNMDDVKRCQGILLTGGIDITPAFYNSQRTRYPNMPKKGWNRERDLFEMKIFQLAQENKLPILAVCRGLQLVNVCLGGTLIADLEEAGKNDHKRNNETDTIHAVTIIENTLLASITQLSTGEVNSAHHQAVDQLSELLMVNCLSTDSVVEGVEWKEPAGKSPLLCVQWHPERMHDKENNPLSENIRNWFLTETKK